MPQVDFLNAPQKVKFWPGQATATNPSTRMIGAEIEIYNFARQDLPNERDIMRKWGISIGYDSSLPAPNGREVRTAPASGRLFEEQVEDMHHIFEGMKPTTGPQAGLHIHIDARKVTRLGIRKVLTLWSALEPTIIQTQPVHRITKNIFGKPVKTALDKYALKSIRNSESDEMTFLIDHLAADRYRGINILPWYSYYKKKQDIGTIEFRLHSEMAYMPSISAWAIALASLVDFAIDTNETILKKIPESNYDAHMSIMKKILPKKSFAYMEERISLHSKEWKTYLKTSNPYGPGTTSQMYNTSDDEDDDDCDCNECNTHGNDCDCDGCLDNDE